MPGCELCEDGWYSSPYIGDFDGDGKIDVVSSSYSIYKLNSTGGSTWTIRSGHARSAGTSPSDVGRTWPSIVVTDIDADGIIELVTAHNGGTVSVYNRQGEFKAGWPQVIPGGHEIRSLTVVDIDGDGRREIICGYAQAAALNTWIFEHDGTIRAGWPQQQSGVAGYAAGVFNDNIMVCDIYSNGAGKSEILVPSDVHYIMAYAPDGTPIPANPSVYGTKTWGEVGAYTLFSNEHQGYGDCSAGAGTTRANFQGSSITCTDADHNGYPDLFIYGNVYDCGDPNENVIYQGPFVFGRARNRFSNAAMGYDWTSVPTAATSSLGGNVQPGGYNVIQDLVLNPVAADIDGDKSREFLYPSFDGKIRVFWMDKVQKHNWKALNLNGEYPTEPIVVDFGNDGFAEVIFATWPTIASGGTGHLYILDYQGNILQKVALPAQNPTSGAGYNGCLAAPTIGNIDSDANLEVVLQTINAGVVAFEIPGSSGARIIWGTGRLNYNRNPNEFLYATNRCTTCKNNCHSACGSNTACQAACPATCNTNRGCY